MALVDETDVQADLEAQGAPDADFLARIASELNFDAADIRDGSGNYDAEKIRYLATVLLARRAIDDDSVIEDESVLKG